tara:strand:- start:1607 stop:1711 length:105 start_codon:yes stop_codon:yes gene_type:complete
MKLKSNKNKASELNKSIKKIKIKLKKELLNVSKK